VVLENSRGGYRVEDPDRHVLARFADTEAAATHHAGLIQFLRFFGLPTERRPGHPPIEYLDNGD